MMDPVSLWWLLVGAVVAVGVEVRGVFRDGKGDTYSEGVWWLRDRLPRPVFLAGLAGLAAFFTWVVWHFGWENL